MDQSVPPISDPGASVGAFAKVSRWYRSNAAAPAILVTSGLGLLATVVAGVVAHSNPARVGILPFTLFVVFIAELVAFSIGDTQTGGRVGGDEWGRRGDDDPRPRRPVLPTGGMGLPAWVGAFDGELAEEPSVTVPANV